MQIKSKGIRSMLVFALIAVVAITFTVGTDNAYAAKRKLTSATCVYNYYYYTGQPIKPIVYVYHNNKKLKKGRDYYLNGASSRVWTYTDGVPIEAVGKGSYKGRVQTTFTIRTEPVKKVRIKTKVLKRYKKGKKAGKVRVKFTVTGRTGVCDYVQTCLIKDGKEYYSPPANKAFNSGSKYKKTFTKTLWPGSYLYRVDSYAVNEHGELCADNYSLGNMFDPLIIK